LEVERSYLTADLIIIMKNTGMLVLILTLLFCIGWACKNDNVSNSTPTPSSTAGSSPVPAPSTAPTAAPGVIPARGGAVTDAINLLGEDELRKLKILLSELRDREKVDFAVLIVGSTGKEDPRAFATRARKEWSFGGDNGSGIFVVAIEDRTWRIQIDEKLQKKISDDDIQEIGDSIVPDFTDKKYAGGLEKAIDLLNEKIGR
jgi:uncharacterized membrane protein YgcG